MRTTNKEIANLLRSVAAVYTLEEKNRFRIIAYENAADAVEHSTREIYDLWENGDLGNVSGIGPTLKERLEEYFKKGDESYLAKTIKKFPAPIFRLIKVPGIGVKKAYKLVKNLDLKDEKTAIEDLIKAAQENKISTIETFGEKSQTEILNALTTFKKSSSGEERMPLANADRLAKEIINYLSEKKSVLKAEALGSLRRKTTTIGDIDIAVVCKPENCKEIIDHFIAYPGRIKTENRGAGKASIIVAAGQRVDVDLTYEDSYGAMLQYFTGSKAHNIKLRTYALKKGYSLSEYGIKKIKDKKIMKFSDEESFYNFIGLPYIPPEIREGTKEVELAVKKQLPRLVELKDIRGDLQMHSSYNIEPSHDLGANTYEEILKKAQELNYEYVAFTDHNPSVGKHTPEQIVQILATRQNYLKSKLNNKSQHCKYFISLEVDILPDGKIALPEKALDYLDMILISIHSSFGQNREAMTARIIKALSYPRVKVLAHPTGRLLGKRAEIDVDWDAVFKECKRRNIAVEINASLFRLDLPDILVQRAKDYGIKFTLGTDAHAVEQMDNMLYGVSVARRGWLEKKDVLNCLSFEEIKRFFGV